MTVTHHHDSKCQENNKCISHVRMDYTTSCLSAVKSNIDGFVHFEAFGGLTGFSVKAHPVSPTSLCRQPYVL